MKKYCILCAGTGGLFVLAVSLMSLVSPAQTGKPAPAKTGKPAATQTGKAAPSSSGLAASIARGKQVYLTQCLACHQADALGVQGMNPPLVKTKFVLGDKTTLVKIVLNGMSGVDVGGEDYHGVMAPHPDLSDQEIADVLTYIRNSFGNKAAAITPVEVKAIRAANKPAAK